MVSGFLERNFCTCGLAKDNAYYIILALVVSSMIPDVQSIFVLVIQAINRHQYRAGLYVICAVLNVMLSIPAAIYYGPIGCAVCTGITTLLTAGIMINIYYWKKIGLNIPRFWKIILNVAKFILPTSIIGFIINSWFETNNWGILILKIGMYTSAYLFVIYFMCTNKEEKGFILQIINRKNTRGKNEDI